jgi:hypothetical protein
MRQRRRFEEFEAIAPGIFGVESADAGDRCVVGDFVAASQESFAQLVEVAGSEGGMGFLGGTKILFDADVELLSAAGEPAAATGTHRFGLFDFSHTQEAAVEIAGGGLAAFGGGDLEVIEMRDS